MKTVEELLAGYALNDGEICSLKLDVDYAANNYLHRQAALEVLIRKEAAHNKWVPCLLKIQLSGVHRIVISEDFELSRYSDVVFKEIEERKYYLSFDPYGNLGEPHENDNLVFVASSVSVEEGVIQDRF
ncbi:hypothetical protein MUN81_05720 [Hymenobacter sp. 5317J-9]|uniref:hypothetical protein n=1 Tax=Hymenobacter sp. 5317J-9 TaxID=2932250 RepID=UPI001FD6C94E|nr:hypothetical protein [Hymenobacter sp. 5317J-9]UOQ98987.1 hypothetical protein MUN81_05720 [Hymenobacter sp. 5317J-9]